MILYSKAYIKMDYIAQNGVKALSQPTRTLFKQYADFKQPPTQGGIIDAQFTQLLAWNGINPG